MDAEDEMMVYCPIFQKKIYDGDCYEIVHCGYGDIKKDMHPEITDWNAAIATCAKCGKNQVFPMGDFSTIYKFLKRSQNFFQLRFFVARNNLQ